MIFICHSSTQNKISTADLIPLFGIKIAFLCYIEEDLEMNISLQASVAYANSNPSKKVTTSMTDEKKTDDKTSLSGDRVEISEETQTIIASIKTTQNNPYGILFPKRDARPANTLANGATNPSLQTFSNGKSFDQVIKDTRAELDAQYTAMKESGEPFDKNSFEGRDIHMLFQNLDRRALFAVSNNEDRLFTKDEQTMASTTMAHQQSIAMGLFSGPSRLESVFTDPFSGKDVARMKANIDFLNSVSPEEKASGTWMSSMMNAQTALKYTEGNHKENSFISITEILAEADKEMHKMREMLKELDKFASKQ
jgi:hypothetical protein